MNLDLFEIGNQVLEDLKEDLQAVVDNALEIRFVVDFQKRYEGAIITITTGGPNVIVDTFDSQIEVYWGSNKEILYISRNLNDEIDEYVQQLYTFFLYLHT